MNDFQQKNARFYGLDGDKIGAMIEAYIIKEEIGNLSNFSKKVENALEDIKEIILKENGNIIFCAGDSILFTGNFTNHWCENILSHFHSVTGRTVSLGTGNTLIEAYLALKLAKAAGGGKVINYS